MRIATAFASPGLVALALLAAASGCRRGTTPAKPAYRDVGAAAEARAADLVGRMTLAEKIGQTMTDAPADPAAGRSGVRVVERGAARRGARRARHRVPAGDRAGRDVRRAADATDRRPSSPTRRAPSSTWPRPERQRGRYQGLTFFSPNVNIFRDPRWGRGQETFGEDPFLTARLGVAFIAGMQGDDPRYLKTAATAKHFAVHSGPEAERHTSTRG